MLTNKQWLEIEISQLLIDGISLPWQFYKLNQNFFYQFLNLHFDCS